VDAGAARRLVAAGVKVVDVRTPEEYAAGHVPGAVNIPFDRMAARHGEIGPPATPVLLYCRSGRRSGIAAGTLAEKGFTSVWDMRTYQAWLASEQAFGSAGH
jgi:rhodanese-related sulfurtransferase